MGRGNHPGAGRGSAATNVYMVVDSDGNEITDGLQEHEARDVAQSIADRRGESVWLSEHGSEKDEEFAPSADQSSDEAAPSCVKDICASAPAVCRLPPPARRLPPALRCERCEEGNIHTLDAWEGVGRCNECGHQQRIPRKDV